MMNQISRARLLGLLVLIAAFVAGLGVGRYLPRPKPDGVQVTIKSTDRLPTEIDALGLNDSQRTLVRGMLRRGSLRVDSVLGAFMPAMDAAIGTTDAEIRAVLTEPQRAALDAERKVHPLKVIKRQEVNVR